MRWKTLGVLVAEPRDHRARQHDPQRRAADAPGRVLRRRRRRSSGWSTPTCWCSPGCCSCSARSATGSAASCALQSGIAIFGLASLGALVADSAGQVIAIRALMGVGAALIMPATLSIIANVFPPEERGKAIGIWAALAAVGIGLGPLAGGLLIEWFDWSAVFLVNVPVALAALLLGIRLVPESRDPRPGAFDIAGAALSTAGFTVLVYAIIEAPETRLGERGRSSACSPAPRPCSPRSSGGSAARRIRCSTSRSSATRASASARSRSASRSSRCSAGSSR